jgi:holo-[acyl-carrier protein] synthase
VHVGTDLIEIARIRRALARYESFRERCFTEAERAYCDSRPNPAQSYAGRFAGKEAVGKALGFGVARGGRWRSWGARNRPCTSRAASPNGRHRSESARSTSR